MQEFEDDFVTQDIIRFQVNGKKFGYKPMTAGEELDRLNEYTYIDENGKPVQDLKRISEMKLGRVVEAPYTKDFIKRIIGKEKEWNELTEQERVAFFRHSKPAFFSKLIEEIQKIDTGLHGKGGDALKNS